MKMYVHSNNIYPAIYPRFTIIVENIKNNLNFA